MRLEQDRNGYLYLLDEMGRKRYILVDVPDSYHYGLLLMGEPVEEMLEKGNKKSPKE